MLRKEKIDILSICTYANDHLKMVEDAVSSGIKMIWLEKPMAYVYSECQQIVNVCKENGVLLSIDHQRRYGQPFIWAKESIIQEKIGKIRNIEVTTNQSCLFDIGTHLIDCVRFIIGDPRAKKIFAQIDTSEESMYKDGHPVEERWLASVIFDGNIRVVFDTGTKINTGESIIRINGRNGFLEIFSAKPKDSNSIIRASFVGKSEIVSPILKENFSGDILEGNQHGHAYFEYALADILDSYEHKKTSLISGENVLCNMEVAIGSLISAYKKKTVTVPFDALKETEIDMLIQLKNRFWTGLNDICYRL